MKRKSFLFLVTSSFVSMFVLGCGFFTPHQKPKAKIEYQIWVDLTKSINIPKDETETTIIGATLASVIKVIHSKHKDEIVHIRISGITHQSNMNGYTQTLTLNSPEVGKYEAEIQRKKVPHIVIKWLKDYQKQDRRGTDLYGALALDAYSSQSIIEGNTMVSIYISDLHHQLAQKQRITKVVKPLHVYGYIISSQGKPSIVFKERELFTKAVKESGAKIEIVEGIHQLEDHLKKY